MEFKSNGLTVEVSPAELQDDQLTVLAREVFTAANERGLELPFATGVVAVEGAVRAGKGQETLFDRLNFREEIEHQLTPAYGGYNATLEQINISRNEEQQLLVADQETAEAEFEEWFDEDRLSYVIEKTMTMEPGSRLTWSLLATPNVTITADEFIAGAKAFGQNQPRRTAIWSDMVKLYTPEEVSGTEPSNGKAFKFKLVSNEFIPDASGDVAYQKAKLAELQAEHPFLESTAPLEDLAWLNTKRVSGQKLTGPYVADDTDVRNFNLEPKHIGIFVLLSYVPSLLIMGDGGLVVRRSHAGRREGSRLSVG